MLPCWLAGGQVRKTVCKRHLLKSVELLQLPSGQQHCENTNKAAMLLSPSLFFRAASSSTANAALFCR